MENESFNNKRSIGLLNQSQDLNGKELLKQRIEYAQNTAFNFLEKTLLNLRGVNKNLNQMILSHPDFKMLADIISNYPNVLSMIRPRIVDREKSYSLPLCFLVTAFISLIFTALGFGILELRNNFNSTDTSGSSGIIVKRDANAVEMEEMILDAGNHSSAFQSPQAQWAFGIEAILTLLLLVYNIVNCRLDLELDAVQLQKNSKNFEFKKHIINEFSFFSDRNKLPRVEEEAKSELSDYVVIWR